MSESNNRMKTFLRTISKIGRASRYIGVVAFFIAIAFSMFNLAGIIGFYVFIASYIFRTDETGETPRERRSWFEKTCDLDPEE